MATPSPDQFLSNILPVNLDDSPAAGRGRFTTVGVLDPAIRIERSSAAAGNDGSDTYRIIATAVLEVAIVGFDQAFQRHARFFDAIALRHLLCRGGDHVDPVTVTVLPRSDAAIQKLSVTRERSTSAAVDAGVVPGMVSVAAPQVSVQAQRDFKVAYQRTMGSWRTGVSFGEYPSRERGPPLRARLAARLISASQQLPPAQQQTSFCVGHAPACKSCPDKTATPPHDTAVLWSWQTEAALRLWTPEIYGSFRCPITVMREVSVEFIDGLSSDDDDAAVRPFLHWDFDISIQLRALGLGPASLVADVFRPTGSRPAELRLQTDNGQRLPADGLRFCMGCAPAAAISWPLYPTRNLQAEAELGTLGPEHVAHRLQTNSEFSVSVRAMQRPHEDVSHMAKTAVSLGDPLALPAIVPLVGRASGLASVSVADAAACRCQSLRPTQNRRYHCCIGCLAGHAEQPTRRAVKSQ